MRDVFFFPNIKINKSFLNVSHLCNSQRETTSETGGFCFSAVETVCLLQKSVGKSAVLATAKLG